MAQNPAPTQTPAAPLWPAPVFVLGVVALAAVWFLHPFSALRGDAAHNLDRAGVIIDQPGGDLAEAIRLAGDQTRSPRAALVRGRALLRRAERDGSDDWAAARDALALAEKGEAGLSESQRVALAMALAKVAFHADDMADAARRLELLAERPDARGEVFELLTRAYLRMPLKDLGSPEANKKQADRRLEAALEANKKHREVADLSPAELAQAQLTHGELLRQQGKAAEARKALEKLFLDRSQPAPVAVQARARLLLARSCQDEHSWDKAVMHYRAALNEARAAIAQPALVYYNLGLCYSQLKMPREAEQAWKQCIAVAQGEEKDACGIVLAQIYLNADNLEEAVKSLSTAVAGLGPGQPWKNPLADLKLVREVFEGVLGKAHEQRRFQLALAALEPYSRIAQPQQLLPWRGRLCAELSRADGVSKDDSVRLAKVAAAAYGEAAALRGLAPAQAAEYLWAAVPCHQAAGERDQALAKLVALAGMVELEPARKAQVSYLLGEEYAAAGDKASKARAEAAFQNCVLYPSRYAYQARYQIARMQQERGEIDACRRTLEENLKQARWEPDPEALAPTLFMLCDLLYGQKRYTELVPKAEAALVNKGQFANRPDAALARFQLADSYRQIGLLDFSKRLEVSVTPATAELFQRQRDIWLSKSAEEFTKLDEFLDSPAGANCLSPEQREQVPLLAAKCWRDVANAKANTQRDVPQEYGKAMPLYLKFCERHQGKAEWVEAMGGVVECLAAKQDANGIRQRLLEILTALKQFPEESQFSKDWRKWVEAVKSNLDPPTNVDVPGR